MHDVSYLFYASFSHMSHRKVLVSVAACLFCLACPVSAAEWLVLSNFNLIDGTGADARAVNSLIIHNGVIAALDDDSQLNPQPMDVVTRIDLDSRWVIPGLIDTHVHVARFPDALKQAEIILKQAVQGGVTSVRDLGGNARALAEINRALSNREWIGPTLVFAGMYGGPTLFADDRIGHFAPGYAPGHAPWAQAITRATDLPLTIAAIRGAGVNGIKLYGNVDASLSSSVIREAHHQRLPVWAHATVFPAGPGDLVDAGVNSLSHAAYLVWEAADEIPHDYSARTAGAWAKTPANHPALIALFKKMAEQGVFLDATLYVYQALHKVIPPEQAGWAVEASRWGAEVTRVAYQHGVKITAGTDWFEPDPGELPHTHQELVLLVEAGLSPMDAIIAGTRNGAESLGVLDERGTIETGKAADILILKESPLTDIRNTTKIQQVIKGGVLVGSQR